MDKQAKSDLLLTLHGDPKRQNRYLIPKIFKFLKFAEEEFVVIDLVPELFEGEDWIRQETEN